MQTVVIKTSEIKAKDSRRALREKQQLGLSETDILSNPAGFGMSVLFIVAKRKMRKRNLSQARLKFKDDNNKVMLDVIVRLENGDIQVELESYAENLSLDKDEVMKRAEGTVILEPTELFKHPLADYIEEDGQTLLNMWAAASFCINAFRPQTECASDNPIQAENHMKDIVFRGNPLVNTGHLIAQAKKGFVDAMMALCVHYKEGMEKVIEEADKGNHEK